MRYKTIFSYVLPSLIVAGIGSIIFLLTTPPQSYILFLLFFLLTATITLTILGRTIIFKIRYIKLGIIIPVFFILASVALLILQFTNTYSDLINASLYVIVFIFAPGFLILRLLKLNPTFSNIEPAALVYPLSIAFITIVGTIALIMPSNLSGLAVLIIITLLAFVSVFSARNSEQTKTTPQEIVITNTTLILILTILISVFFYVELYPAIVRLLGLDTSRNFLQAIAFTKDTGSFYHIGTLYPLFGVFQSSMIYMVQPSLELSQIISVFLNLLSIIAFYAMAKQHLKKYGDHTPSIATLMWTTFAGFGWLDFLAQRINNPDATFFTLIEQAQAFSYGDITWRRLFFGLSMETSLVVVFAILYFLKRTDLSKTKQILIFTILLTPLPLMHKYALYFLLPCLICIAIFQIEELKGTIRNIAASLIIASFASLFLNHILTSEPAAISINYLPILGYLLTSLALMLILSLRKTTVKIMYISIKRIFKTKCSIIAGVVLLAMYFAVLLFWFSGSSVFNFYDLNIFGYVPWFLYPVKLGLLGILALTVIILAFKHPTYRSREVGTLLVLLLAIILTSRSLATIQMHYVSSFTFDPNSVFSESIRQAILSFREERMFELFKIPLAIIASIVLGKMYVSCTKQKSSRISKGIIFSGLVSIILISGMASTFLGFEYFYTRTQTNEVSLSELNIINELQSNVYANGKAIIISPQTPRSYLDFTGADTIVTESTAAWIAKSPELPLFVTRYSKQTPTFIYLDKTQDSSKLADFEGNYLAHLVNISSTYIENPDVHVKTINNWSLPTPESSTALVIPYDAQTMALSKPEYLETYKKDTALALFFEETPYINIYQEPIIYNNVEIDGTANFNGENSYIQMNGTEINFERIVIEFEFQPLNLTKNQVIVSKFDWGASPQQMSWDVAQFGSSIAFKISPDGKREETLSTNEILELNEWCKIRCEYDGTSMKIFVNNELEVSKPYQKGIFQSNVDLLIGAELYDGNPTAIAKMMLRYLYILDDTPEVKESIFYAYDFLSSAGLNYTTILSTDNNNDYATQILPYDDMVNYELINTLETDNKKTNTTFVVLNTNGYGPILNLFGNVTSESFAAKGILTETFSGISPTIDVPMITLNDITQIEAQYTDNSLSSPFIMVITKNELTIIYVNIYPIIQQSQLLNPTLTETFKEILSNSIMSYDENTINPWFTEPSLLFTRFNATGTISIQSNRITLVNIENQTLNMNYGADYFIQCNQVSVQGGYGFYTVLTAFNPSILPEGNQTKSIELKGNVTFVIRQPEISVNGTIQFENFYMMHPITVYTDGRTCTLSGNIELQIYVSDEYTIAMPYSLNSPVSFKYEQPIMEFDETTSIIRLMPYVILIAIFSIPIVYIQQFESKHGKQEY